MFFHPTVWNLTLEHAAVKRPGYTSWYLALPPFLPRATSTTPACSRASDACQKWRISVCQWLSAKAMLTAPRWYFSARSPIVLRPCADIAELVIDSCNRFSTAASDADRLTSVLKKLWPSESISKQFIVESQNTLDSWQPMTWGPCDLSIQDCPFTSRAWSAGKIGSLLGPR